MTFRVEDLAPANSGYNVVYNPLRSSRIADSRLDHGFHDMHSRTAYNGEMSRMTEVGYKPIVPWNGNIYDIRPAHLGKRKCKGKKKKVRFSQ